MPLEQIKEIISDGQLDSNEVKNLEDVLKDNEKRNIFKESLKQTESKDLSELSNATLNYFKDNLNTITIDAETRKSFWNIISFLYDSNNFPKQDMEIKKNLNTLKTNLTYPNNWIKWQIQKYPDFLKEKINPLLTNLETDPGIVRQIEMWFSNELKFIRLASIDQKIDNQSWYFDNIIDYLVDKKYSKELLNADLINHMKQEFLSKASPEEIVKFKKEIKEEISWKSGNKIKEVYSGNLNSIYHNSENLSNIKERLEDIEKKYKASKIQEKMEKIMNEEIQKYLSDQDDIDSTREEFTKYISKKVKWYDLQELRNNYKNINDENKFWSEFKRKIWESLRESIADLNREYIKKTLQEYGTTYNWDKNLLRAFEDMLWNTDTNNINNMAYILSNYPDQKNNHITNILDKIWKKKVENCKKFTNVKLVNTSSEADIARFRQDIDASWKSTNYKTLLKEDKSEYFDEESMKKTLDSYSQNDAIAKIKISIPEWKDFIYAWVQKQLALLNNPEKFDIKIVNWLDKIQISWIEKKETPWSINLKLEKLDANAIWDPQKIKEILSQNSQMKNIVEDPNYVLTGGEINWTASRNPTNYQQKFWEETYEWIKIQKKRANNDVPENNEDITNNPWLAYDRAHSFLDYFIKTKDIQWNWWDAIFNINYNVIGPNKEELKKSLQETNWWTEPSKEDILKAFKEYQNAEIKLDFIKKEESSVTSEIDIQKESIVQWMELAIVWDAPSWKWWFPDIDWPRIRFPRFSWGSRNLDPNRFRKCAGWN